jgi:peptidyl-prolyl cis-trans isomerase-like 4
MINNGQDMHGSQFLITLSDSLDYLDGKHTVFGQVAKGFDILEQLNECLCDKEARPYQDIRILHTVILDDPFEDFAALKLENDRASPEPTEQLLASDRIRVDEDVSQLEGLSEQEIVVYMKKKEANTRAKLLEIIGDIPDADVKPPENVLFVCKLNPVTTDQDLELIFSRFGKIVSCEVIRDRKSGDSLCYAFIEFDREDECENAFFKMDNVLIDDRRIHVDFSQSVSKVQWKGKGTGTGFFEDNRNYKAGKNSANDENNSSKAQYRVNVNDKSRKGKGYDLVFDEDGTKNSGNNSGRKYEPIKREHSNNNNKNNNNDHRDRHRYDKNHESPSNDKKRSSHAAKEEKRHSSRDRDTRNRDKDYRDRDHDRSSSNKSHRTTSDTDYKKKSSTSSSSSSRRH